MTYTISQLAELTGVSVRTLRYYDEIDLLKPKRDPLNGYRLYSPKEVDLLQQILFYRELDLKLADIKKIIHSENFDAKAALENHLIQLNRKKERLEAVIETVQTSIRAEKGEIIMTDQEKFAGFKKELVQKNEEHYGEEIREKYGDQVVGKANAKMLDMSKEQYKTFEATSEELNHKLKQATLLGDAKSELAKEVAELHKSWLIQAWPKGYYDEEKHHHLSKMYIQDERFKAYYDTIAPGAAEFLYAALTNYLKYK